MSLLATSSDTLLGLLVYVVGLLISFIFVARLLTGRQSPAATLLWVIIIVAAPYVGLLFYYLLPHRIHLGTLRRRSERAAKLGSTPPGHKPPPPTDPAVAFLERIDPGVTQPDNCVELLESGEDFFARLEDAIRTAEHSVHVEMYIFRPDATGLRVLRLLGDAAARGVEVRLLYDHIGSWSLKSSHLEALVRAGGKAVSYAPLLWRRRPFTLNLRNHRKLVVVDGCCAFLGGRNIADEYANDRFAKQGTWFDAMLEIRGPGVLTLQSVFVDDWFHAANEELNEACYFPREAATRAAAEMFGSSCWVGTVASGPDHERNSHRYLLFEMIGRARKTIDISSPYLVPHPTIETALAAASMRGVRIRLHCNGRRAERFVLYHAARSRYARLLELGVEIIETVDDYNHAKIFLVDGQELLLSSANLDMRSFELNFEVGALVVDAKLAETTRRMFEKRAERGHGIEARSFAVGPLGRLIDGVCRLLSPIL